MSTFSFAIAVASIESILCPIADSAVCTCCLTMSEIMETGELPLTIDVQSSVVGDSVAVRLVESEASLARDSATDDRPPLRPDQPPRPVDIGGVRTAAVAGR